VPAFLLAGLNIGSSKSGKTIAIPFQYYGVLIGSKMPSGNPIDVPSAF
jgi:hypothetical protein